MIRHRLPVLLVVAQLVLATSAVQAQATAYVPSAENLAARVRFQDMKLGMFIHWGPAITQQNDMWDMEEKHYTVKEYESIAPLFNPVQFDAKAWVQLAQDAGFKYITLITKHHDGFALWDTKLSDWNIMQRTPFKRDIVREMADACRAAGMPLFLYYSQLDWHSTDFFPRGGTGRSAGRPASGDFNKYLEYMDGQLSELLTNYGPIGGIWFDGMWDRPEADWKLRTTYDLIHRLQPSAMVGSNHHKSPFAGEDFQMFEKDLPGANSAGFNTTDISSLPLETAETVADGWGFRLNDRALKPLDRLVRYVVNATGRNANFLLNVGPMASGEIWPAHAARLRELGAWIKSHGEALYGTRGGPIAPRAWGVTTQRGNRVYVHVLDWPDPALTLPPLGRQVVRASLLIGGAAVPFRSATDGVTLTLPARAAGEVDQIIVLELAR